MGQEGALPPRARLVPPRAARRKKYYNKYIIINERQLAHDRLLVCYISSIS